MSNQHPHPPPNDQPNTVTITLTTGDTMEVHPHTPVLVDGLTTVAWRAAACDWGAITIFEPTREFWTPYEPWMRDVLADDAQVSWLASDGSEYRTTWWHENARHDEHLASLDARVHPDDVPERPAEDDPDEALADLIWAVVDNAEGKWVSGAERDEFITRCTALAIARAAREHIESMGTDDPTFREAFIGGADARAIELADTIDRAEKAEAERDEWKARHVALRADVVHEHAGRTGPVRVMLSNILDRDAAREPQPDPDTVTLPRDVARLLTDCWESESDGGADDEWVTRAAREALGWKP